MVKVVVTGIGLLTALGENKDSCWKHTLKGESGIGHNTPWPADAYPTDLVGAVSDAALSGKLSKRDQRRLDRCHKLALVAADEALSDSGIQLDDAQKAKTGLYLGTSLGGMTSGMEYYRNVLKHGPSRHPRAHFYPFHICLDILCRATGFSGARSLVATACTASTLAAAQAFEAVNSGLADRVLLGGVDPLCEFSFAGFSAMKNVSTARCAPFSDPIGLSLGEGAAFFMLEREEDAIRRGARIYAEMSGYALGADAYHPTAPDPSGRNQKRLLREALGATGLKTEDIGYINAHGTGTQANDICETNAIREVFGDHAAKIAVSSTKGATGHTLGAAGCVELAMTVMAVATGELPPTANFTQAREGCDLDYVPNQGRKAEIKHAISQNFAFGGNNAALVISRPGAENTALPGKDMDDLTPVVTGMGVIAPNAIGADALLAALKSGTSGLTEDHDLALEGQPTRLAGAIRDFNPAKLTRTKIRRADRLGQLAVCAADQALAHAKLRVSKEMAERTGVFIGTDRGPAGSCESFYREIATGGLRDADPKDFPNTVLNACSGLVSVNLRLRGPNIVTTVGMASGAQAIALGAQLIQAGKADAIIVGGCDELTPQVLAGYGATRQLSPDMGEGEAQGLFLHEARANGAVLGEGAGFLVLESKKSARTRKARILAELAAYAIGGAPDFSGASIARTMESCISQAGLQPDMILSGAIGQPGIDQGERQALEQLQATRPQLQVSAPGSLFGMSGATPAFNACAAVLGLSEGFFPAGPERLLPAGNVRMIEGKSPDGQPQSVLVNGLSIGGTAVSLMFCKSDGV
ncbi:beta-ketoacyl-[acyl-carrier-protein] synthase family protein [Aestuariispira insulae]|uniref:3-oxoacyl-[acyl-carrier-protein] synthase II n=1 Tax=Aestuariispira insulae TaxID=1461337 RepID=A0A3D9H3X2_9PROT|nr:beta-ketoacyl-[acyl-carrier-protein] synthase family protein [Aestuariispira insulae]RED44194.1 3-oxoacyl-[acyl-carrier-protein] synthase II [Aestuariispira insulae]